MAKSRNTFEKTRREAEKKRNAQEKRLRRRRKQTEDASTNNARASDAGEHGPPH
ncbi:MAG: hypothetical protein AB7U73_03810 [Pirellulales bacterium]